MMPKRLDSVVPHYSEEPARYCIKANGLKVANQVDSRKTASEIQDR